MNNHRFHPSFMLTITAQMLEDGILEIRRSFVEKLGRQFPKFAFCLTVPTGAMWRVELRRDNGRVWLEKGWKEFVKECRIKSGFMLSFQYDGDSFFKVVICNTNSEEIAYPALITQRVNTYRPQFIEVKEEDIDTDSSVMMNDQEPLPTNETPLVDLCEDTDTDSSGEDDVSQWEDLAGSSARDGTQCEDLPESSARDEVQCEDVPGSSARDGALNRARAYHTSNPHFIVIMPPTCRSESSDVYVPDDGSSYFHGNDDDDTFYVYGPDKRSWCMKYCVEGPPLSRIKITEGWIKFAEEYGLQDGDVCVFELTNTIVMVFDVHIFRISYEERQAAPQTETTPVLDASVPPTAEEMQDVPDQQMGMTELSESAIHTFSVVHKGGAQMLYALSVPNDHASIYLAGQHTKEVILRLGGKIWPVQCYSRGRSGVKLQSGWKDFVVANDLKKGDTLTFELQSEDPNCYRVTISRTA